ncbi:sugar phosphate nucleotidyltransferase [Streptomyces sp. NPDC007905]|uniref:sugar phosphate nucleotidyltransferase n=1 Tax=Streptomyces sp. NPDC007905 TaxID=3364788 RepID=UPI0036E20ED4
MEPTSLVVLAGGRGSRLGTLTDSRPKPLVPIGDQPILWHILKAYEAAGVPRSVIAGGYRVEQLKRAFSHSESVEVVDTGATTSTAGRLLRLADRLPETFCLTYADGLSDVPLTEVIGLHLSHRPQATITAVHPPSRFGTLSLSGRTVTSFEEKTTLRSVWVNGGFMVLNRSVLDLISGDDTSLEQEVLPKLAATEQLIAYQHDGFWYPMDTVADMAFLNVLWQGGAPWRTW